MKGDKSINSFKSDLRGKSIEEEKAPLISKNETQFKPFGLFWNIVKSFAGAGTFALPWAVMNAGLWGGLVGIILVAFLSNFTIRTLFKCGDKVMQIKDRKVTDNPVPPSYPEIGRTAYGEPGAKVVSTFSALMCFGVCLAYFTLIADNVQDLFPDPDKVHAGYIVAVTYPIAVFLSCLTDLTKLAYTSIAGCVALIVGMTAVVVYGLDQDLLVPIHEYPVFEWKTLPLFLGNAAFLFCGHVILVPLANTCGNYKKFPPILDYGMVFVAVINIIFAGLSYGYWREKTCGNVIGNLPSKSVVGDIVRVGIALEVLASFPLVANGGFQALETGFYLEKVRAFPYGNPNAPKPFFSTNIFYYLFRGGVIIVLAILASVVKNFGVLVSLVGSLTIAATGFIFPQVFYLKLYVNELKKYEKAIQYIIILFGFGLTALGTYQSMEEIISTFMDPSNNSTCGGGSAH